MERETPNRLGSAIAVLTEYFRLLDTIPEEMSIDEGEVMAGEYLRQNMLSGQYTADEIARAHIAVDRDSWGETDYARRVKSEQIDGPSFQ